MFVNVNEAGVVFVISPDEAQLLVEHPHKMLTAQMESEHGPEHDAVILLISDPRVGPPQGVPEKMVQDVPIQVVEWLNELLAKNAVGGFQR